MAAEPTTDGHHLPHLPAAVLHAHGTHPSPLHQPKPASSPQIPIGNRMSTFDFDYSGAWHHITDRRCRAEDPTKRKQLAGVSIPSSRPTVPKGQQATLPIGNLSPPFQRLQQLTTQAPAHHDRQQVRRRPHACGHDPAVHPTPPSATDPASPISPDPPTSSITPTSQRPCPTASNRWPRSSSDRTNDHDHKPTVTAAH
ncbi:hypothetical protein ACLOJK_023947, partial [Asimina triloba]